MFACEYVVHFLNTEDGSVRGSVLFAFSGSKAANKFTVSLKIIIWMMRWQAGRGDVQRYM